MGNDSGDAATRAFDGLSAEIAVLRRAIERLGVERVDQIDYSPTLGQISQNLLVTGRRVDTLSQSPLLSLTPAAVGKQIERLAADTRYNELQAVAAARAGFDEATRALASRVASARKRDEQFYWLLGTTTASFIVGFVTFLVIIWPIARVLPASWKWPETFAANTMGMTMWDAGMKMMATANPEAWNGIAADYALVEANKGVVTACRKAVAKAGKPVRCQVKIER